MEAQVHEDVTSPPPAEVARHRCSMDIQKHLEKIGGGHFRVVNPTILSDRVTLFEVMCQGAPVGQVSIETGSMRFPTLRHTIRITSDFFMKKTRTVKYPESAARVIVVHFRPLEYEDWLQARIERATTEIRQKIVLADRAVANIGAAPIDRLALLQSLSTGTESDLSKALVERYRAAVKVAGDLRVEADRIADAIRSYPIETA